jgi:hypothetical protein
MENPKIRPKRHVGLQFNWGHADDPNTGDMPMTQTVNDSFPSEAFIDAVIAACDGDMRETIKALLVVNEQLETELQQLYSAVEHGSPSERRVQSLLH